MKPTKAQRERIMARRDAFAKTEAGKFATKNFNVQSANKAIGIKSIPKSISTKLTPSQRQLAPQKEYFEGRVKGRKPIKTMPIRKKEGIKERGLRIEKDQLIKQRGLQLRNAMQN